MQDVDSKDGYPCIVTCNTEKILVNSDEQNHNLRLIWIKNLIRNSLLQLHMDSFQFDTEEKLTIFSNNQLYKLFRLELYTTT